MTEHRALEPHKPRRKLLPGDRRLMPHPVPADGKSRFSELEWSDVRRIRHRSSCPVCRPFSSGQKMAKEYGISTAAICKIIKRTTWAIDPEPDPLVVCPALQFVPAIYARSIVLAGILLERRGILSLPKSSGGTERSILKPEKPTRPQRGRDGSSVVLTKADVRMIRHRADCPDCKPFSRGATMAREYGVYPSAIVAVLSGKTWKGENQDVQPVVCPARRFVPAIEAGNDVLIEILRERGDLPDSGQSVAP